MYSIIFYRRNKHITHQLYMSMAPREGIATLYGHLYGYSPPTTPL